MHIVRYIAYLGTLGTIKASSMQPYLSAINRLYMDHKLQQVALGPLVVDAVAGLAGMQQAIATSSRRAPLPAAVAKAFHDKAGGQAADISAPLLLFRNNLSTITSFMYFNRSDTTHSLHEGDLSVDPIENSDRQIRLFPRQRKGQKRVAATKIDAALIPVDAHPRFASMIIEFKRRRADAYAAAGVKPPLQLWAIPGDRPSTWTSDVQNRWMESALTQVSMRAPPGYSWTSHSLRSGPASAARAIGAPLEQIRYYGGWARNSDVVLDYIDPTVRPSKEGRFFFGWLFNENQPPPSPDGTAVARVT